MHFFASFVLLLLAELVSADKLEWSGVGPGATACKKTYLNSDVTYVFALFVTYPRNGQAQSWVVNPIWPSGPNQGPDLADVNGNSGEAYFTPSYNREYEVCVYNTDQSPGNTMSCNIAITPSGNRQYIPWSKSHPKN